jgi:hypothetical protein
MLLSMKHGCPLHGRGSRRAPLAAGTSLRRYHFGQFGAYLGYLDEFGQYRDRDGAQIATLNEQGALYDESGAYRGRIDALGQYWDETGRYHGYFRAAVPSLLTRKTAS